MRKKLANFKDPVGLVKRMLLSGNLTAWSALIREALSWLLAPLAQLLKRIEQHKLKKTSSRRSPILLIVGAPRSGTTLIYQVLSHYLPVSYCTNLGALFPESPLIIESFARRLLGRKSSDFRNFYGTTAKLLGPNEGFYLWNRWLGYDRYQVPMQIEVDAQQEMRQFFSAWHAVNPKPFLNKNNRNTAAIRLLHQTLETVYWIIVERDPVYTAQSLLIAREMVQGDRHQGWGLAAKSQNAPHHSPLVDVVDQVYDIHQSIQAQLEGIETHRYIKIPYQAFCDDPNHFIRMIYARIWQRNADDGMPTLDVQPLECRNHIRLPETEFEQLQQLIRQRFATKV